jgi:hypothetical protein
MKTIVIKTHKGFLFGIEQNGDVDIFTEEGEPLLYGLFWNHFVARFIHMMDWELVFEQEGRYYPDSPEILEAKKHG